VRLGGGIKIVGQLELSEHTYPKYPAPVVIQQAGDRLLMNKTWGIPVTIKGAKGQHLSKPVTNARNDKLGGYAPAGIRAKFGDGWMLAQAREILKDVEATDRAYALRWKELHRTHGVPVPDWARRYRCRAR
jgi:hypothetical protein